MKFIICILFLLQLCILNIKVQAQTVHWESVILEGDEWKYFVPNSQPSAEWNKLSYDDSLWTNGNSGFGYGDNDDKTILSNTSRTVYLRKKFNVIDLTAINNVLLHMDFNDGFVAYLNGFEIARENITGISPLFDQFANSSHEAVLYQGRIPASYSIDSKNLINGINILAVEIHNVSATSSNLTAIPILSMAISNNSSDYRPTPIWFPEFYTFFQSNLPIVKLTSVGSAINNDTKVPVIMQIIDNGPGNINYSNQTIFAYEGTILTEWQGFTAVTYPKKNYDFDLLDNNGNKIDTTLLGMPSENDWIFKAEYADPSLLKNSVAYEFSRRMGNYAPRTRPCEIILDGLYIGYYTLTEVVKRSKQRVNIAKLKNDDVSGENLTGGYIIELNNNGDDGSWNSIYPPINNSTSQFPVQFKYVYPKSEEINLIQGNYIKSYVDSFEYALQGNDYLESDKGYRRFIDVATFIDYLIVNEFTVNYDSYARSVYIYKDKITNGGKLKMGPVWDYDESLHYFEPQETEGWVWQITHPYWPYPFWWSKMWTDQTYKNELAERWKSLRKNVLSTNSFVSYIDSISNIIAQAEERNFTIWDVRWGQTSAYQTDSLKSFLIRRLNWIDKQLLPIANSLEVPVNNNFPHDLVKIFPNPTKGRFSIRIDVIRIGTIYNLYNQLGKVILTGKLNEENTSLDLSNLENGIYLLNLNAPGLHTFKISKL